MLKSPVEAGIMVHQAQHIGLHHHQWRSLGKPMPMAIVIGGAPALGYMAVSKVPYGVNEYSVAGGILGEPMELVKCETVDIEVPANAEIVFEGLVDTDHLELEAPFGEYTGYMGLRALNPVFRLTCITHRKKPIYQAFISQMPPSESSVIKKTAFDGSLYKLLRHDCNIPAVQEVALQEMSGSTEMVIIRMKKTNPAQPWQALNAAAALDPMIGKIIVAVDDDIDPNDPGSVIWALSFRMQPHRDIRITQGKASMLDPSSAPPDSSTDEQRFPSPSGTSAILIDATLKWPYSPVSLPAKEYMERAKDIWHELGLPELKPALPWHGYSLGYWTEENEEEAKLAVLGRYFETGKKLGEKKFKF
jgi:4-hydroxy-3-polyprenylbenzoate decarboxylase